MLGLSKWLLIISGVGLIIESIMIMAGIPNPLFGWPLPCPTTFILLGAGILLFGIYGRSFKEQ